MARTVVHMGKTTRLQDDLLLQTHSPWLACVQHNWSSGEIRPTVVASPLEGSPWSAILAVIICSGSLLSGRISMIGQLNYVQQLNYVLSPSQNSDLNDCVSETFCISSSNIYFRFLMTLRPLHYFFKYASCDFSWFQPIDSVVDNQLISRWHFAHGS